MFYICRYCIFTLWGSSYDIIKFPFLFDTFQLQQLMSSIPQTSYLTIQLLTTAATRAKWNIKWINNNMDTLDRLLAQQWSHHGDRIYDHTQVGCVRLAQAPWLSAFCTLCNRFKQRQWCTCIYPANGVGFNSLLTLLESLTTDTSSIRVTSTIDTFKLRVRLEEYLPKHLNAVTDNARFFCYPIAAFQYMLLVSHASNVGF